MATRRAAVHHAEAHVWDRVDVVHAARVDACRVGSGDRLDQRVAHALVGARVLPEGIGDGCRGDAHGEDHQHLTALVRRTKTAHGRRRRVDVRRQGRAALKRPRPAVVLARVDTNLKPHARQVIVRDEKKQTVRQFEQTGVQGLARCRAGDDGRDGRGPQLVPAMHDAALHQPEGYRALSRHEARAVTRVDGMREGVERRRAATTPRVHRLEPGVPEGAVPSLPLPTCLLPGERARTDGVRRHGPACAHGLNEDRRVALLPARLESERRSRGRRRDSRLRFGLRVRRPRPRLRRRDARVGNEDAP